MRLRPLTVLIGFSRAPSARSHRTQTANGVWPVARKPIAKPAGDRGACAAALPAVGLIVGPIPTTGRARMHRRPESLAAWTGGEKGEWHIGISAPSSPSLFVGAV